MSDKKNNETHAAVIAEMRKNANEDDFTPDGILGQSLHCFANRAEAAYKREIEEAERRGNHSAMKAVCETIEKVGPLYDADSIGDSVRLREALMAIKEVNDTRPHDAKGYEINDIITEALAAPARNCDRFHIENDAMIAFLNEVWLISVDTLDNDPFDEWTPQMKERYARWLLEEIEKSSDNGKK